MNTLTQPVPDDEGDVGPALSEAEMDAWIARNRDAINESLREARQELAEGKAEPWDMEEILAEVEEELRKEGR
jgi:hypothetical protein